jgi:hypothetical protein
MKRVISMVVIVLASQWGHSVHADADAAVAIVVHPAASVSELSMTQLRKIFLAEKQFWQDNSRVTILVRAPGAVERELVLDRIYQMNEDEFRQYWIAKMFRAEVPSGPKIVFSANMALELVKVIKGSITFISATELTPDAKVIRIDGFLPGDEGYPLR